MTRPGPHGPPPPRKRWERRRCDRPSGRWARLQDWRASDDGRVTAFVVVLTTAILALAGLTLDGGLALAAKVKANGQAESAARAGADAIDLNAYRSSGRLRLVPARAVAQAQDHLAGVGASGTVTVSGDTVIVAVTAAHRTQLLGLVGIAALPVHGSGSAHPQRGVVTIEP